MKQFTEKKIEFIAKTITDLGKAIFVVGMAGYFFEKLPVMFRVSIGVLSVLFIFAGIIIYPEIRSEE